MSAVIIQTKFSGKENNTYTKKYRESVKITMKWTGGDLNPRPPECKSGVHTS